MRLRHTHGPKKGLYMSNREIQLKKKEELLNNVNVFVLGVLVLSVILRCLA